MARKDDYHLRQTGQEVQDILDSVAGKASLRSDTTAHWNAATGFVPEAGELIIYTDYKTVEKDGEMVNVPGIKIGSGNGYVQDLAFVGDDVAEQLLAHINDNTRHVTLAERVRWNNKLNVDDEEEVEGETLVMNRN